MNPETETLLLREVAPRIRAAIPKTVPLVGSDDPAELVQDGMVIALLLYRSAREAGKKVSAGNLAYYAILALRSGRRSTGYRTSDVLHPAAQLSGRARVQSIDEPIHQGDDGDELTLHDCLAAPVDDPATIATRRLDWQPVLDALDPTALAILIALIAGTELTLLVRPVRRSRSTLQDRKVRLGRLIKDHLGEDILFEVQSRPVWTSTIDAVRQRLACRAERRAS